MGPTLPLTTSIYWGCIAGSLSTGLCVRERRLVHPMLPLRMSISMGQPQSISDSRLPSCPLSPALLSQTKRSSKAATMVHGTHPLLPYHHRHPTTCSHTFPILCSLHILLRNRNSVPHEGTSIVLCKFFLKVDGNLFPLWKDDSLCENNGHGGTSDVHTTAQLQYWHLSMRAERSKIQGFSQLHSKV